MSNAAHTVQVFSGFFSGTSEAVQGFEAACERAAVLSRAAGVTSVAVWAGLTKVATVKGGVVTRCNVAGNVTICAI